MEQEDWLSLPRSDNLSGVVMFFYEQYVPTYFFSTTVKESLILKKRLDLF
ncbi:MAG: hypothetical protein P4L69_18155 [Desulfosporosinus sp.]|nr:hypothetical protein [Desulfosporosinus sp.]